MVDTSLIINLLIVSNVFEFLLNFFYQGEILSIFESIDSV